jgi:hypothetical protein
MSVGEGLKSWVLPVAGQRPVVFYLRCLRILAQLVAAYWFSNEVSPFFYQQF